MSSTQVCSIEIAILLDSKYMNYQIYETGSSSRTKLLTQGIRVRHKPQEYKYKYIYYNDRCKQFFANCDLV